MSERERQPGWARRPSKGRTVVQSASVLLMVALACVIGYGVTSLIYPLTGKPPALLAQVLSCMAGFLVLFSVMFGVGQLVFRYSKRQDQHNQIHSRLLDAMEQISRGNFDVILDPRDSDMHWEFAQAINEMAKNLGTLDTMRQDFISNVSHELQSPLTSISGFAALLRKEDLTDEERRHYISIIESESKRLSSLSENLLKLSTLDHNKNPLAKADFRLDKQLESVALTLEPQWTAKQLGLEADLQKCTLRGDQELLSQVWINLLHNAVKFTPPGGHIMINLSVSGENAVVRISDSGLGMAPEDQIHIFERFYKADKARDRTLGGNGLGLSLVKKIVELHGGSVSVESALGRGASFEIALPGLQSV